MKMYWKTDDAPFLWLLGEITQEKTGLELVEIRNKLCSMHTYLYIIEKGANTCKKDDLLDMYEAELEKGVQGFIEKYNEYVA